MGAQQTAQPVTARRAALLKLDVAGLSEVYHKVKNSPALAAPTMKMYSGRKACTTPQTYSFPCEEVTGYRNRTFFSTSGNLACYITASLLCGQLCSQLLK